MTDKWIDFLRERYDDIVEFLEARGYKDYDLEALANAESFDVLPSPDEPNQLLELAVGHEIDRIPPAEIVKAAQFVKHARWCLELTNDDDPDLLPKYSFVLGGLIVDLHPKLTH